MTANNGYQQRGFFAAQGLYPANRAEPRPLNLTATSFAHFPSLQQKLAMPRSRTEPTSFCPLSPEAYLLTEKEKKS